MYYVISSIFELYGDDLQSFYKRKLEKPTDVDSRKALTVRELLIEQFFLPWLTMYFRDTKCEGFTMMASQEMHAVMQEMKVNIMP